jgi:hypothetical protein
MYFHGNTGGPKEALKNVLDAPELLPGVNPDNELDVVVNVSSAF